jgi:hypothetical protein
MEISEIIKNSIVFPSKNIETLSIYAILLLLSSAFTFEGVVTIIFGIVDIWNIVIGAIYILIAFIIGIITRRISIQCIKTGVEMEDYFPDFKWWETWSTGISKIIISIFYFIVPALLTVLVALITNVFGSLFDIVQAILLQPPYIIMEDATVMDAIHMSSFPLFLSLALTFSVGAMIFLIFSFFQAMSEARLANTGSLKKALNLYSAAKDIKRIGIGKLVLLSLAIFLVVLCIESVLALIFDHLAVLSILNIIIVPYITLFSYRALGLLYSDIV